ncbi:Calcineurinlike phosphoesterase [Leishmania braziliensis]|nr:Calcineurinlike phosphoesterase [Leishmania braziliensis]
MKKSVPLATSHKAEEGGASVSKAHTFRPACVETSTITFSTGTNSERSRSSSNTDSDAPPNDAFTVAADVEYYLTNTSHHIQIIASPSVMYSSNKPATNAYATTSSFRELPVSSAPQEALLAVNSPPIQTTDVEGRLNVSSCLSSINRPCQVDAVALSPTSNCLRKVLDNADEMLLSRVLTLEDSHHDGGTNTSLGISECSSTNADDLKKDNLPLRNSGKTKDEKRFFSSTPRSGEFVPLIEWLLRRGERGDVGAPAASQEDGGECTQAHFFSEDYLMRLCAAATAVLEKEPTVLELEVLEHDTLVVVGDIHGQFQDLYTSVLCQQYDRHQCNLDGRDRRFLFMGDYVDRGPHSLQVVLLLLALKVEYPTLVYLMRGNHEEERTSRVYGFLTEVTSSLGAATGAAVWSAVNKVFLDLPLAAIVQSLYMRFFVTHGGLSPTLQKVDDISRIDRHAYDTGKLSKEAHSIVEGLLWSDPCSDAGCFAPSSRGCGWNFGPTASSTFCKKNELNFICRAHQLTMDGYFWTHDDRVVTVFSAPNYCGVNNNRGAVMVVSGEASRPFFHQYECYEERNYSCPDLSFHISSYFN